MLQAITSKLKSLYRNAQEELGKTPIQSSAALAALIVILLPLGTYLWTKGTSSNVLIKILSTNTTSNSLLLVLTLSLLVWSLVVLHKINKPQTQREFEFLDYLDVSWKIINPDSSNLKVDFPSYCIEHRVQHISERDKYLCPICGNEAVPDDLHKYIYTTHKAVENLAKAKRDKHAQAQRQK